MFRCCPETVLGKSNATLRCKASKTHHLIYLLFARRTRHSKRAEALDQPHSSSSWHYHRAICDGNHHHRHPSHCRPKHLSQPLPGVSMTCSCSQLACPTTRCRLLRLFRPHSRCYRRRRRCCCRSHRRCCCCCSSPERGRSPWLESRSPPLRVRAARNVWLRTHG